MMKMRVHSIYYISPNNLNPSYLTHYLLCPIFPHTCIKYLYSIVLFKPVLQQNCIFASQYKQCLIKYSSITVKYELKSHGT